MGERVAGGGGQSGRVGYPPYMEAYHTGLLHLMYDPEDPDGMLYDRIMNTNDMFPNPYTGLDAVDPGTSDPSDYDLTTVLDRYNLYYTGMLDEAPDGAIADWLDYTDAAAAQADALLPIDESVEEAVKAFERQNFPALMRSVGRFAAGMADINATMNSSFIIGMAMLEQQFQTDVASFRAAMEQQARKERTLFILQAASQMGQLYHEQLNEQYRAVTLLGEIKKTLLIAEQERQTTDLGYDTAEIHWPLDLFSYGGNMLSSISGAAVVPRPLPKWASALSGAFTATAAVGTLAMRAGEYAIPILLGAAVVGGALGWAESGGGGFFA